MREIGTLLIVLTIFKCTDKEQFPNTTMSTDSNDNVQPVVFLSHGGGPSFFLDAKSMPMFRGLDKDSIAADFLRNFSRKLNLQKPEAVLVISAHWESSEFTVNMKSNHSLYFDYYNFPPETYKLQWPARGSREIGEKVISLLTERGLSCREEKKRGLDHGVFVPLKLVFPTPDMPGGC